MKKFLIVCLATFFVYQILIFQFNDQFSLSHINSVTAIDTEEEKYFPPHLFHQKFFYIGKGSQAYIFLAEDGETILKLFRFNRFKASPFFKISKNWFAKKQDRKNEKLESLLVSLEIAQNELQDECGLIYTHYNKSETLPHLTIVDRVKRSYEFDPNETYFVLQKKGDLLYSFLLDCKNKRDLDKAVKGIRKLIFLISKRDSKGIQDRDLVLSKNIAFLEDEPIFIDIGEFCYRVSNKADDLAKMFRNVEAWVKENYPEFAPLLKKELSCLHFF